MAKRDVTITITIDDKDNETLEMAAVILRMSPDKLLAEILGGISQHLKDTFNDLRMASSVMTPTHQQRVKTIAEILFGGGRSPAKRG